MQTRIDPVLSKVYSYCLHGWPDRKDIGDEFLPFVNKKDQLHLEYDCIVWGYRMVIPTKLRSALLAEIHLSHLGINKSKALARSYFWWPSLDADIERMCKSCKICAAVINNPPKIAPRPWPLTNRPWSRLHLDFLGPIFGKRYLILIDTYTKWIEVEQMSCTNAESLITYLRKIFCQFGLPDVIVSDNGPPFSSAEFSNYLKLNGIRQMFSPPYHPQSNGAAENAVKIIKNAIKKAALQKEDINIALCRYLFDYRNISQSTTEVSPAVAMFGRNLKSRLDLLIPNRQNIVERNMTKVEERSYAEERNKVLDMNEEVLVKSYTKPNMPTWEKGIIKENPSQNIFEVKTNSGNIVRRHSNQIRPLNIRKSLPLCTPDSFLSEPSSSDTVEPKNATSEQIEIGNTVDITSEIPSSSRYNLRPRN
nr:uncharacterized protein K02A2.6-like [Onthophagus taurus]